MIGMGIVIVAIGLFFFLPQLEYLFMKGCTPNLSIDNVSYEFKTLFPKSDHSIKIPKTGQKRAYWIAGTTTNNVFVLISSPENQALINGLSINDIAKITWANCNSSSYSLTQPIQGNLLDAVQDQSTSQLTFVLPKDDIFNGTLVVGNLQGEVITSFNTPDASMAQFDVSLLGVVVDDDKSTITIEISLNNYGQIPVALTEVDFGLIPDGGTSSPLLTSDPNMPLTIKPGEIQPLKVSFYKPSTLSATLKILSLEMIVDGY